eukprot:g15871.t1
MWKGFSSTRKFQEVFGEAILQQMARPVIFCPIGTRAAKRVQGKRESTGVYAGLRKFSGLPPENFTVWTVKLEPYTLCRQISSIQAAQADPSKVEATPVDSLSEHQELLMLLADPEKNHAQILKEWENLCRTHKGQLDLTIFHKVLDVHREYSPGTSIDRLLVGVATPATEHHFFGLIKPTVCTYYKLVEACAMLAREDQTLLTLHYLRKTKAPAGVRLTAKIFNEFLSTFAARMDIKGLLLCYQEMRSCHVPPDENTYALLAHAFAMSDNSPAVISVLQKMKQDRLHLSEDAFLQIYKALDENKDWEGVRKVFTFFHKRVAGATADQESAPSPESSLAGPGHEAYNFYLRSLSEEAEVATLRAMVEELKADPTFVLWQETYSTLIRRLWAEQGQAEALRYLSADLEAAGGAAASPVNVAVFNTCLQLFLDSHDKDLTKAEELLDMLRKYGIAADALTYDTLTNLYLQADRKQNQEKALAQVDAMKAQGITPLVDTFNRLLSLQLGADRTLLLLAAMREMAIAPNNHTFLAALKACEDSKTTAEVVLKVFDTLMLMGGDTLYLAPELGEAFAARAGALGDLAGWLHVVQCWRGHGGTNKEINKSVYMEEMSRLAEFYHSDGVTILLKEFLSNWKEIPRPLEFILFALAKQVIKRPALEQGKEEEEKAEAFLKEGKEKEEKAEAFLKEGKEEEEKAEAFLKEGKEEEEKAEAFLKEVLQRGERELVQNEEAKGAYVMEYEEFYRAFFWAMVQKDVPLRPGFLQHLLHRANENIPDHGEKSEVLQLFFRSLRNAHRPSQEHLALAQELLQLDVVGDFLQKASPGQKTTILNGMLEDARLEKSLHHAMLMFQELCKRGVNPSEDSFRIMFSTMCEEPRDCLTEAGLLIEEADSRGIKLDATVWTSLLASCKHKKSLVLAQFLLDEVHKRKILLNRASHVHLIEMCSLIFSGIDRAHPSAPAELDRLGQFSLKIYCNMLQLGYAVDNQACEHLMRLQVGTPESEYKGWEIFTQMKPPNEKAFAALLEALINQGRLVQDLDRLKALNFKGDSEDTSVASRLLEDVASQGDVDVYIATYEHFGKASAIVMERRAQSLADRLLVGHIRRRGVSQLQEAMQKLREKANIKFTAPILGSVFHKLSNESASAPLLFEVLRLIQQLQQHTHEAKSVAIVPDKTFEAFLHACMKDEDEKIRQLISSPDFVDVVSECLPLPKTMREGQTQGLLWNKVLLLEAKGVSNVERFSKLLKRWEGTLPHSRPPPPWEQIFACYVDKMTSTGLLRSIPWLLREHPDLIEPLSQFLHKKFKQEVESAERSHTQNKNKNREDWVRAPPMRGDTDTVEDMLQLTMGLLEQQSRAGNGNYLPAMWYWLLTCLEPFCPAALQEAHLSKQKQILLWSFDELESKLNKNPSPEEKSEVLQELRAVMAELIRFPNLILSYHMLKRILTACLHEQSGQAPHSFVFLLRQLITQLMQSFRLTNTQQMQVLLPAQHKEGYKELVKAIAERKIKVDSDLADEVFCSIAYMDDNTRCPPAAPRVSLDTLKLLLYLLDEADWAPQLHGYAILARALATYAKEPLPNKPSLASVANKMKGFEGASTVDVAVFPCLISDLLDLQSPDTYQFWQTYTWLTRPELKANAQASTSRTHQLGGAASKGDTTTTETSTLKLSKEDVHRLLALFPNHEIIIKNYYGMKSVQAAKPSSHGGHGKPGHSGKTTHSPSQRPGQKPYPFDKTTQGQAKKPYVSATGRPPLNRPASQSHESDGRASGKQEQGRSNQTGQASQASSLPDKSGTSPPGSQKPSFSSGKLAWATRPHSPTQAFPDKKAAFVDKTLQGAASADSSPPNSTQEREAAKPAMTDNAAADSSSTHSNVDKPSQFGKQMGGNSKPRSPNGKTFHHNKPDGQPKKPFQSPPRRPQ